MLTPAGIGVGEGRAGTMQTKENMGSVTRLRYDRKQIATHYIDSNKHTRKKELIKKSE